LRRVREREMKCRLRSNGLDLDSGETKCRPGRDAWGSSRATLVSSRRAGHPIELTSDITRRLEASQLRGPGLLGRILSLGKA